MKEQAENRDFKYIMQDVSSLYIGAKMTLEEMIEWEEVPFKWKAVMNRFFVESFEGKDTLPEVLCKIETKNFALAVLKQLKVKVKAGSYETVRNKTKYKSHTYSVEEFTQLATGKKLWEELIPEEIVISKLALMMFSA